MRPGSQRNVQRDGERCGASVGNAMLSRGVRRWMQWQSEQPVRRLQERHPQRRMPSRLSSWPLSGKNSPLTFSTKLSLLTSLDGRVPVSSAAALTHLMHSRRQFII